MMMPGATGRAGGASGDPPPLVPAAASSDSSPPVPPAPPGAAEPPMPLVPAIPVLPPPPGIEWPPDEQLAAANSDRASSRRAATFMPDRLRQGRGTVQPGPARGRD